MNQIEAGAANTSQVRESLASVSDHDLAADLQQTIEHIGLARFVGRMNSGVIDSEAGLAAVTAYVARETDRPLVSKVVHFLLCKEDSYKP